MKVLKRKLPTLIGKLACPIAVHLISSCLKRSDVLLVLVLIDQNIGLDGRGSTWSGRVGRERWDLLFLTGTADTVIRVWESLLRLFCGWFIQLFTT